MITLAERRHCHSKFCVYGGREHVRGTVAVARSRAAVAYRPTMAARRAVVAAERSQRPRVHRELKALLDAGKRIGVLETLVREARDLLVGVRKDIVGATELLYRMDDALKESR